MDNKQGNLFQTNMNLNNLKEKEVLSDRKGKIFNIYY